VSSPTVITPLSKTSDISHHPPGPLPRGEILCPGSDFLRHPPVLYQEGRSLVRDRTSFITPLSSTRRGDPLSEIGLSSSPPCPLPRGVVLCPKLDFSPHLPGPLPGGEILCPRSDFPHHPPVLYREGWSIVRDRTFLITPLSSTKRGGSLTKIGLFSSPPWSSTRRGDPLSEIGLFSRLLLLSRFFNEVITPLPIF
jgi:hypothetical protein